VVASPRLAPAVVSPTATQAAPNSAARRSTLAFTGDPISTRLAGVWTSGVDANTSADLGTLGLGWARTLVTWSSTETSPGVFAWDAVDQSIAAASAGGSRHVLVQVRDNPAWAAASPCKLSNDLERAHFASFLTVLVTRYKAAIPNGPLAGTSVNVKYWQLYNEADNTSQVPEQAVVGGCFGTVDGSNNATQPGRDSYASMLESAGLAIHTVDPSAFVVMAGVASGNFARGPGVPTCPTVADCPFDPDFVQGVLFDLVAHGTLDRVDMIAVHYFSSQFALFSRPDQPDLIGRVEALRTAMRAATLTDSQLKGIIVDEGSYTNTKGASTSSPSDTFNLLQRNYLVKAFARAMYARVEAYFWFWLRDATGGLGGDNAYGLRAMDGGSKPAFTALRRFASLLDQRSSFVGKVAVSSPLEAYEFRLADGRRARLVWNEADTRSLPYHVSDGVIVEATDAQGGALTVADNTAQVGSAPMYLILGTPQNCRPGPVRVTAAPSGGALSVSVGASSSTLPIQSLIFHAGSNALVDVGGLTARSGELQVSMPPGSFAPTFVLRRAVAGAPSTLPVTVVDGCGTWETFVGGGAGAF
jgi:hypothetical protein